MKLPMLQVCLSNKQFILNRKRLYCFELAANYDFDPDLKFLKENEEAYYFQGLDVLV